MTLNLKRGQRVDLTKGYPGLRKIKISLGKETIKPTTGRLIDRWFSKSKDVECHSIVLLLGQNDGLKKHCDVIKSGNTQSRNSCVQYYGNQSKGKAMDDDEIILVDLKEVPGNIQKLMFLVNLPTERNRLPGCSRNTYIRISNHLNQEEIIHFNIPEECLGLSALIVGEIYRHGNEWKFSATGKSLSAAGMDDFIPLHI